jgi:predicted GNAT family acetyltransferase
MRFPIWSKPLQVVTMGAGAVLNCHPERLGWLHANLGHLRRDAIFSATSIGRLARHVEADGQYLAGPDLKYACSCSDFRPTAVPTDVEVTLVEGDDIVDLYRFQGFDAALAYHTDTPRPDVMATVARCAGEVVGIAGASADCETMWQIGVEVVEGARGQGIGRALVGRLTEGILGQGKIPYYTTAVSNIRSRTVAISLGYWPAWTELYARDR